MPRVGPPPPWGTGIGGARRPGLTGGEGWVGPGDAGGWTVGKVVSEFREPVP